MPDHRSLAIFLLRLLMLPHVGAWAQASHWPGLYKQQGGACHGSARDLSRHGVILGIVEMYGRYTGRRIVDYLVGHGHVVTRDDVASFGDMLRPNIPTDH